MTVRAAFPHFNNSSLLIDKPFDVYLSDFVVNCVATFIFYGDLVVLGKNLFHGDLDVVIPNVFVPANIPDQVFGKSLVGSNAKHMEKQELQITNTHRAIVLRITMVLEIISEPFSKSAIESRFWRWIPVSWFYSDVYNKYLTAHNIYYVKFCICINRLYKQFV